ncbi:hypothetical protein [Micromonospora sp. NPDC050200]|uniref:hypothetical protein n=1 Tax=Micromonospora sp. NPDC050200 TaxID=3155664 RepID=UPI0033E64016
MTTVVNQWLRLVVADAELSPYLIGVDLDRLAAHLGASVTAASGDEPAADAWAGLGLSEAQRRRIADYLVGVLWALDLPGDQIDRVRKAVCG